MTRGYVVIVKDKTIIDAIYQNADSYLSGLGLEVLEAFKNKKMQDFLTNYHKENPDCEEDVKGITLDWIIKTESTKGSFFVDYAYVYDSKKETLTVYNYGDLAFKVTNSDIEVCEFVFENDSRLYKILAFDKEKLDYMYDSYKNFRAMLRRKATLDEYKKLLETPVDSFHIETGREVSYFGSKDYYKRITDIDTEKTLKFLVTPETYYGDSKNVYVVTPIGKIFVNKSSTSNGADKLIKKTVADNRTSLMNLIKLFDFIDEYKKELENYMFIKRNYDADSENSQKQLEETMNRIKNFYNDNLIYGHSKLHNLLDDKYRDILLKMRKEMLESESETKK